MSSNTIAWNESIDPVTGLVSQGPADFNSLTSSVRVGLSAEHVWPSSSGLAGAHLQGSARVFVGATSKVSSADTDGRLMIDSTKSRLWYVGSEATFPLGGRMYPEMSTGLSAVPAQNHWVISAFTVSMTTAEKTLTGIPTSAVITATVDSFSRPFSNVRCTIASDGESGNVIPMAALWNTDGTPWSGGTTLILHVQAMSLSSY